jgi:hypothetical protein
MTLRGYRGDAAAVMCGGISPIPPITYSRTNHPRGAVLSRRREGGGKAPTPLLGKIPPHELGTRKGSPSAQNCTESIPMAGRPTALTRRLGRVLIKRAAIAECPLLGANRKTFAHFEVYRF